MVWERIRAWLDNPILVKHVRSRLRLQPLLSAIVVVQALCLCIAWGGFQLGSFSTGGAYGTLLFLQIIIIVAIGGSQVATAVGGSRSSGILDFHRVSPLTRDELTLGFFFGAPIREYVLLATTMPYAVLCVGFGVPSAHGLIQLMIALVAFAWLFQGMALLSALLGKSRAGSRGGVGVVVVCVIIALWLGSGLLSRASILVDLDQRLSFFGVSLPWLAVMLIYISAALFFVYLAARRRMGSERIHPLSKAQGVAGVVTISILCVGGIWQQESYDVLQIVALYFLVGVSIFMIVMVTPSQAEYLKGLLRAKKQGLSHLSAWDDLTLNRLFLAAVCAILLVTGTVIWRAGIGAPLALPAEAVKNYPLGVAMGVLVVAYIGLGMQYFMLRFGARGKMYFGLFLFLTWILPMVAGTIFMLASMPRDTSQVAQIIYAVSPCAGLAMCSVAGNGNDPHFTTVLQGSAITPALFCAFIFNSLLISARRRLHRDFLAKTNLTAPKSAEELPASLEPAAI
jgi:hypothetical protein